MRTSDLKALWHAESEAYKKSEVGSGVQRFVWEMLKSPDYFCLTQGQKSTPDHDRRSEFLLEERRKNRQADAVIFIDSEVVIPVEVERFEHAVAGEWQIHEYRTTFEKKYGILTDGFEWRFYYGEIADGLYYTFTLSEMFSNPPRFLSFWEEYIKPSNYYLSFFESVGQQSFSFTDTPKRVDQHRSQFFSDVTDIIRKLKDKLLNAGYFRSLTANGQDVEHESNKKATETAYSYLIQFILYKTLVDNGFPTYEDDFNTKLSSVHRNLQRGSYNQVPAILDGMSQRISANIYKPFHQEQKLIIEEIKTFLHSGQDTLLAVAPFLDIFLLIKRYDFGNVKNDIFGAIYENYLKELYYEQLGQYFTDPEVVDFMLSEIGYSSKNIKGRNHMNISIIDPSCGSGTFLYSAIRELVAARGLGTEEVSYSVEDDVLENIFGLDIAEFPLYLAEMSILMRLLPLILTEDYNNPVDKKLRLYATEDSLSEFILDISETPQKSLDLDWAYHGFMRDEADLSEMKASLREHVQEKPKRKIPRRRFDFVIGNPPYIGYNQASKAVGVKLFQLMKQRSVQLSNIYGWNLHSVPGKRKKYPPKPNLFSFFIALGFALLKDDERFCYIVPQTLLTEPDHDVIRYHLSHDYTIETMIVFGGKLFVGRSIDQSKEIHASSLILVCTKRQAPSKHEVECVVVPDDKSDVRDVLASLAAQRRNISHKVRQRDLRANVDNWNFITWAPRAIETHRQYKRYSESIAAYFEHRLAERRFGNRFYFDVGFILDRDLETNSPGRKRWGIVNFQEFVNFTGFRPTTFYPSDESAIQLPRNSQGYQSLYREHKLLWEKSRKFKFYYTDKNVVPSMSHCQIISSDSRDEILFLFAVLNSSITRYIFEAAYSIDNEKVGMYIGVSRIKSFVRVPLVDSTEKRKLKQRVIAGVSKALDMEGVVLADFVDIDTLARRVSNPRIVGRKLVVSHRGVDLEYQVKRGAAPLVEAALAGESASGGELFDRQGSILTAELRALPAFDPSMQQAVLEEVDEWVLDLYGIPKSRRPSLRGWRVV